MIIYSIVNKDEQASLLVGSKFFRLVSVTQFNFKYMLKMLIESFITVYNKWLNYQLVEP